MYIYDFIQGLIIGGTLIIAIGPQNLFVIQPVSYTHLRAHETS